MLELAADAELELFYGDPFRCDASFIDTYVDHSGEPAVNLVVRSGVKAEEIRARLHGQISVQLLGPGSAVEAVIFDGPDASICSEIVARSEGMPFDCLDRIIGTIDRHDEANGRASVNTEATRFCTLSYRRFPEVKTWEPGTHVAIQGAWLGDHLKPYRVQLADALSTSS
ncbi:MAG TPA: hypothetical protein VNE17_07715 [Nitrolancea sp.]|nr:hypothetical protein [Nitrolancea sp.]